ncbi:MAG: acetyl-CoA C-acetyltransferase [Brevinema sp.]
MSRVFIIDAKRTPVGSFNGVLSSVAPGDLGAVAIKAILQNKNFPLETIDEVIMGNVLMAGQKQGIARQSSIKAHIPNSVPAYGVNMICGSGMKTLMIAYSAIKAGINNLTIAGGTESMSNAPFLIPASTRKGFKMGDMNITDHMVSDALTDAFKYIHMGITAENIAHKFQISREEQDQFAYHSQQKAITAIDSGRFLEEICPVEISSKKGVTLVDTDEYPNRKTTLDILSGLRPAFSKEGSVTAGNASGINDGAAAFLLASEEAVNQYKLNPIAEIIGIGQGGCDPETMGLGPAPAIKHVLKSTGMNLQDIELYELNEAFAAQALGVIRMLSDESDMSKEEILSRCNVNGGAIAIGHPVGASGTRISVTLLHEMIKRNVEYGLASLCIGGGMGTAVIFKKI